MRLIGTIVLFGVVCFLTYCIGALITTEHDIWRWPASFQVGAVFAAAIGTAALWEIFGIGRKPQPWDQIDHYDREEPCDGRR